jgi:hypothetical protein
MVKNKNDIALLIRNNQERISGYGVSSIGLFGSFAKGDANASSDIDILVEFVPGKKNYDNFINLAYYLEEIFDRKVELVTPQSLSKRIRPYIEQSVEYVTLGLRTSPSHFR